MDKVKFNHLYKIIYMFKIKKVINIVKIKIRMKVIFMNKIFKRMKLRLMNSLFNNKRLLQFYNMNKILLIKKGKKTKKEAEVEVKLSNLKMVNILV